MSNDPIEGCAATLLRENPRPDSVREIPLTKGYVALVDEGDYERISAFRWHVLSGRSGNRYGVRWGPRVLGKPTHVYMHHAVLQTLPGIRVDHRDGDGLNNTRANLRPATASQNNIARIRLRKDKTSKFRGVSWDAHNQKWRAAATFQKKCRNFGNFDQEEDAARAFDHGVARLYGEWARFNFPEEQDCSRAALQEQIEHLKGTIDALTNRG